MSTPHTVYTDTTATHTGLAEVPHDNGIIYTEAVKKFKKDSRKSTGALKEFWDLAFEEGRRVALIEEEERRKLELEKVKATTVEEVLTAVFGSGPIFLPESNTASARAMSKRFNRPVGYSDAERITKMVQEQSERDLERDIYLAEEKAVAATLQHLFGAGPIFLPPFTDDVKMQNIAQEYHMDVVVVDNPNALPYISSPAPMLPEPCTASTLDWAGEVADIPIHSVSMVASISNPTSARHLPVRDLSAIRPTSSSKPFGSIQRRARRCHRSKRIHQYGHCQSRTPHIRPGLGKSELGTLDWEKDPRLVDLSCALRALGWIRPV